MREAHTVTAMELFVLGAVRFTEWRSGYHLYTRLGLSPGALRPVIRRLEANGLLRRSEQKARRRRELSLTPSGESALYKRWGEALGDAILSDGEAVIRVVWTVFQFDPATAGEVLTSAAEERQQQATEQQRRAESLRPVLEDPLGLIQWLRATVQAQELLADARAFKDLAGQLLKSWPQGNTN